MGSLLHFVWMRVYRFETVFWFNWKNWLFTRNWSKWFTHFGHTNLFIFFLVRLCLISFMVRSKKTRSPWMCMKKCAHFPGYFIWNLSHLCSIHMQWLKTYYAIHVTEYLATFCFIFIQVSQLKCTIARKSNEIRIE